MRSPSLNVIIKALDKISSKIARDFGEIENLQSNNFAASKFANACYKSIKEKIIKDLSEFNPDYNIRFLDGDQIIADKNSRFCYVVAPIDGLLNLSRSIPSFSNVIALEEEIDGKKEITNVAISDVAHNHIYFASKGGGAFLNNRRIRVSDAKPMGNILCAVANQNLLTNSAILERKMILRLNNCSSLDVAHYVSGKLDLVLFAKNDTEILKMTSVLVKEAGGSLKEKEDFFLVSNNKITI